MKPAKKKGTKAFVKRINATEASSPELVDGPADVTVGADDLKSTEITLSLSIKGTRIVRRTVVVHVFGSTPTVIVLEAPEAQWDGVVDTLMGTITG